MWHPICACGCAGLSRRGFLAAAAAGAAAYALPARPAMAQTALTPDAALKTLLDGNQRFVARQLQSCGEDLAILKRNTVEKQAPFAAVLSCADSRVPVELVFDQSIGHVFTTRVAGNIATPDIVSSLEYGVAVLGVAAILVLGHASCGAVKAAMANKPVPGQISQLFQALRPAVAVSHGDLETAIKDNALIQANLLATASPLLAQAIEAQKLKIVAGYYALDTGTVTLLS